MSTSYKMLWICFVLGVAIVIGSCGSSSDSPTTPVGTPTPTPVTCGGVSVAGYCWYFGALAQSCNTVCANHGSCNAAGITYAGAQGTAANCRTVLNAIGAPADTDGDHVLETDSSATPIAATGCTIDYQANNRIDRTVWWPGNCSAADSISRRACACNN